MGTNFAPRLCEEECSIFLCITLSVAPNLYGDQMA